MFGSISRAFNDAVRTVTNTVTATVATATNTVSASVAAASNTVAQTIRKLLRLLKSQKL